MDDSARATSRSVTRRRYPWCCHIGFTPASPDNLSFSHKTVQRKPETTPFSSKPHSSGVPDSPQSSRSVLSLPGRIHARRILSPGRVSPIDPDHEIGPISSPAPESAPPVRARSFRAPPPPPEAEAEPGGGGERGVFDVRLNLRGKNGSCLALELSSEVLSANSVLFAGSIAEHRKGSGTEGSSSGSRICRIEVPEVENLAVFKDAIELMFEGDITRRLVKIGVYRSIDILEVSAAIMFDRGVSSCLKYLEAVPWSEDEEEKLRTLFGRIPFDNDATGKDIMARLYMPDDVMASDSQESLAKKLVWSITGCVDNNARNELKSLVKGLLCRSSVYEKDHQIDDLKEGLYATCQSCLDSLVRLFEGVGDESEKERPLIERVSRQVDNVTWMVEILLDWQMAEEFVDVWASQAELLGKHETASPMVRYEVSRVSAVLFMAMGTRKLQCRSESRARLMRSWFGPMLADFGWLQRRKKGLDTRALEEAMGLTLLTLPPSQQYALFMEWFRCFSRNGAECPNLSKAFQVWWRRSFLRGPESR